MPSLPRIASISALFFLTLVVPAHSKINTDDNRHDEEEKFRGDFRYYSNRGNFDAAIRMGIATFEGQTYYAFVDQAGTSIRIAPQESNNGKPSKDGSLACDVHVPGSQSVPEEYRTGNAIVVDLIPRDGILFLVCRGGKGQIFVQGLKSQLGTNKPLVLAGSIKTINAPIDMDRFGSKLVATGAVNGNDGLYVHGLWNPAGSGNLKLATYRLKRNSDDFDRVLIKEDIPSSAANVMINSSDAAGTQEFNSQGQLDEVHYFTWAAGNNHLWLARFLPANDAHGASYESVVDTGYEKMPSVANSSVLTLMEGGMSGDTATDYSLSLVEFATSVGSGGETSSANVSVLRQLSLSTAQHRYVGDWTGTDFNFENAASDRHLAYFATAHWGIDKGRIVPVKASNRDQGPYHADFQATMQQLFRFSLVAFYTKQRTFIGPYDYTSFHTADVRGNRYLTDPTDPHKDAITTLDTTSALSDANKTALIQSWTLIGVVHGIPPYLVYNPGKPYPTLKFTYAKTASTEFSISDTTEDSKEVTVAVSLGGGAIDRGAGAAKGLFSVNASYSYGFTTVDGSTTTTTKTNSVQTTQTFEPDNTTSTPADNIGVLLYSAPVFVSKGYSVRRWNSQPFTDTARNIYQTVVAHRELQMLYYRLDDPAAGPLMGASLTPNPALAALTVGIPAVPRTSAFGKWRTPNLLNPVASYDQFTAAGETASFEANRFSSGTFSLDYTESVSTSKSRAETKSHKGTVSVSGGLKDIFSIDVSGSISHSNTFSTTSSATTSVGQGISGDFPKLPASATRGNGDTPVGLIHVNALLLYAKGNNAPEWTPTALRGSSSPFLLTWTTRVENTTGKRVHTWR